MHRTPRAPRGSTVRKRRSYFGFRELPGALGLVFALAATSAVAGCSSDAGEPAPSDPNSQETGGAAGESPANGGAGGTAPGRPLSATGGSPSAATCPTYQDDFLPQVNAPVCSKCHPGNGRLPDWGVYSQAQANCSSIGSKVASGSMPPRSSGYSLSAAQRALVASWVKLGCPRTKSNLPGTCN